MKTKYALSLLFVTIAAVGCQLGTDAPSAPPKQKVDGFFITTLPAPVGWTVVETKGLECRFFEYSGTGDYIDRFKAAIGGIKEEGAKLGSNAFVNLHITSESFELQGSKWHSSIVHMCGDLVVIK